MAAPSYVSVVCGGGGGEKKKKKKRGGGGGGLGLFRGPPKGLDCGLGGCERGGTWGVKG